METTSGLPGTLPGSPEDALVATFAYRLFSRWLPLPFGLLGVALAPRADQASAALKA